MKLNGLWLSKYWNFSSLASLESIMVQLHGPVCLIFELL